MELKAALRKELRARRRAHVDSLDTRIRALMFMRPPSPVTALVPAGSAIGLYLAGPDEAPATAYARFFHEAGHTVALPFFESRDAPMQFRRWDSPWVDELLERGPWGVTQPAASADPITPDVVFVPLVGFSADGGRLGQGGGHYDRWLAANRGVTPIGMAWDCQMVDTLPHEPHDIPLRAVVTPTRIYGPWETGA